MGVILKKKKQQDSVGSDPKFICYQGQYINIDQIIDIEKSGNFYIITYAYPKMCCKYDYAIHNYAYELYHKSISVHIAHFEKYFKPYLDSKTIYM